MNQEREVVVRFAPSPTGALHLGGIRTALYNFLFAKKNNGKFLLRIEDTDQKRYVPGAEEYIFKSLEWLGLETDENPTKGGPSLFYRQSERNHIYKEKMALLLERGNAYYAFDTPEDLENMRERLLAAKITSPKYNTVSREFMKNSLVMPEDEVKNLIAKGVPYVIRLKTPHNRVVRFFDEVRGWVKVDYTEIEDKVLVKSDGIPTYHFANVVDDYMMKTSHVIRGEEWLSSTPVHVLLYEAFGWENEMPKFVHLPLILKPDGKGKLSKRDTDQLGFPIFPLNWTSPEGDFSKGLKESGYLPEGILNFLALMGWNPGIEKEVFSLNELAEIFSLDRIGKSGAKFNIEKAKWFNSQHLNRMSDEKILHEVNSLLNEKNIKIDLLRLSKIIRGVSERNNFFGEIVEEISSYIRKPFYNKDEIKVDEKIIKGLNLFLENLKNKTITSSDIFKEILNEITLSVDLKKNSLMPIIRYAISGQTKGIDLFSLINFIDEQECFERITNFLSII